MEFDEYKNAVLTLNRWNKEYYETGFAVASDDEYDTLFHKIKDFEKDNPTLVHTLSPTHRVGHTISNGFKPHRHIAKLYSQQDFFNIDDVVKWAEKIEDNYGSLTYVAEAKYDGLSLSLTYDNGVLVKAATRGDGEIGEDVTDNAKHIPSIPMTIYFKWKLEIHGEVVMSFKVFNNVNSRRVANGDKPFSNPRNAAVGVLKSFNSKVVEENHLTFIAWGFGSGKPKNINSLIKLRSLLAGFTFKVPTQHIVKGSLDIPKAYEAFLKSRARHAVPLDGIVFKVADTNLHNEIGHTEKFPKWSCAMKFPPNEKTTRILDIINQVGRTGVITPVAVVKSVVIDGSVVKKATLHNYSEIANKDIRIGDEVIIIKSGDIIPKITTILKDRRTKSVKKIIPPTECPVCGTKLVKKGVELICENNECVSKVLMKLVHFVGRDYMDINGLGLKLLEKLVEVGAVKDITDLYELTPNDIYTTGIVTPVYAKKLFNNIQASKETAIDKFIAALGIPNFGRTMAKRLVPKYGMRTLELTEDELLKEDGIGRSVTEGYIKFMRDNKDMIEFFKNTLTFKIPEQQQGKLDNEVVVLTGSFPNGKMLVRHLIESNGGVVSNSITKKTTMVVYGENAGKKLATAKELNIKTLTLGKLMDFLNE